ncbi:MAG: hypothetical protein AB7F35_21770 [Acetobacteraceae bacterium]
MIRVAALVFMIAAVAEPVFAADLPVPPVPPASPPRDEAAPVPNVDIHAPSATTPSQVRLGIKMYTPSMPDGALAFSPGSRYQSYEERKPVHLPGLKLTVPLQ